MHTHPGVENCELEEATAISQLATNWHPAAVASPVNCTQNDPSINYKKLLCESCRVKRLMTMEAFILSLVNQPFSWYDQPQFCKVPLTHTEYYTVGSEQPYCFDDFTL